MKDKIITAILAVFVLASSALTFSSCKENKSKVVKVGLLHALTGTMSISEVAVRDAELLAIKEINEAGGILGYQIKPIEEDGKSNPRMFAEKARKLIESDGVATIFDCWTSDSRKAVKPVVEELYNLLWYPVQY
jgi:urea transport system substrate-binding protein